MIDLPQEQKLTREFLLQYHSEEEYLSRYCGIPVQKKLVNSPFREDRHPSCSFFRASSGRVLLYDFSKPEYTCDFIKAAAMRYNCTSREAMRLIAEDYGIVEKADPKREVITLPEFKQGPMPLAGDTDIRIAIGEWDKAHLAYWAKYNISLNLLKRYRVYRCIKVYLNGNEVYRGNGNVFGYFYGEGKSSEGERLEYWKIYFPGRKKMRFLSSWKKDMVQGYKQLKEKGKLLVITKSMKDVMCLASFGVPAIAPSSESSFIPDEMYQELKKRFTHIVLFYDNDLAGIKGMIRVRKQHPGILCFFIPRNLGCKDFSDLTAKYGEEKSRDMIREALAFLSGKLKQRKATKESYYMDAAKALGLPLKKVLGWMSGLKGQEKPGC